MIPDFLEDELDNRDLEIFLEHIEHCKNCREELTIQFLVETGTKSLEDGKSFNLTTELGNLIQSAWQRLIFRKKLLKTAFGLQVVIIAEIAIAITLAIIL